VAGVSRFDRGVKSSRAFSFSRAFTSYSSNPREAYDPTHTMQKALTDATEAAIRAVDAERFFETERGFHGRFYCAVQEQLDQAGLIADGAILEMEYQKSSRHGILQRPDIVFHIPPEYSGASVRDNNFAVWALKRRASLADALADFDLLDEMFEALRYPVGFFLNIDSLHTMRQHYNGRYGDRVSAVAAKLADGRVQIRWAHADTAA